MGVLLGEVKSGKSPEKDEGNLHPNDRRKHNYAILARLILLASSTGIC